MADTKTRQKHAKRREKGSRRNLKSLYSEMSDKDRKKFVNSEEKVGIKAFLAAKDSD